MDGCFSKSTRQTTNLQWQLSILGNIEAMFLLAKKNFFDWMPLPAPSVFLSWHYHYDLKIKFTYIRSSEHVICHARRQESTLILIWFLLYLYISIPGEAASSPQHGPGVNTQMMTSLPSPFTLSSLPVIDRVCVAKACPGRDTNSLLRLCECWPGYWYRFR